MENISLICPSWASLYELVGTLATIPFICCEDQKKWQLTDNWVCISDTLSRPIWSVIIYVNKEKQTMYYTGPGLHFN